MGDEEGQVLETPEGQPSEAPADGQVSETPEEQEPFFTLGEGDKQQVFNTRDELEQALKTKYVPRDVFTKKTQSLAEERKKLKAEQEAKQKELEERKKRLEQEYGKFDSFIKNRPDVYKELKKRVSAPPDPSVAFEKSKEYVDSVKEELRGELEEFKQWKQQQEAERQKSEVYNRLAERYEDFDKEQIEDLVKDLSSENDIEKLYETLYFAQKGRSAPKEVEKQVAENQRRKRSAGTMPPGGASKGKETYGSLDELANKLTGG